MVTGVVVGATVVTGVVVTGLVVEGVVVTGEVVGEAVVVGIPEHMAFWQFCVCELAPLKMVIETPSYWQSVIAGDPSKFLVP